jgi:polynucleotide 5'-kinase involved in rRNA processing
MRHTLDEARVVRLAEDSLFLVGETREFISKDLRLVRFLGGLRQARSLEVANAQGRVEQARARLREAETDLKESEHRDAQCAEIELRIVQDFGLEQHALDEAAKTISKDAKAIGVLHMRPELTECSPAEKATV